MVKKTILCLSLALCAGGAVAQQKMWSLEQCISYALTNNLQVKQEQLNIDRSENALLQSKLDLIPDISGSGSYGINWGRSFDQANIQYVDTRNARASAGARASVPLFGGLQRQNTIKKNSIDLQAATQDVEKLKNDLSLNIAGAFLQILLDMENLQVAKGQLETTGRQLDKTKKLVDAGNATIGAYLELQAQQATEEVQLVTAQNKITLSYLNLKQLLDLQHDTTFRVGAPQLGELPEMVPLQNVDRIFDQNAESRPEVKSAELRLKSAEKSLSIARGGYYPSLSLSGEIGTFFSDATKLFDGTNYYTPSFGDQFKDNISSGVSLGLSIPIFNGWMTRTNVRNAKLSLRNSELQLQTIKNNLYKEIQQAETDAEAALKRYHASQKNVSALEESFRYVEQKFNLGMVDATDYNVAKNNITKAQSDLIQSKYQYIFQTKILDFYKGVPLKL